MDKSLGGDPDFSTEQDEIPLGINGDEIEVNFVDDDAPVSARRGQNEADDFFEGDTDNDDAEFEGASQSVKNRIMRERRLRMEAEQRLNAGYQELDRAEEGILNSERQKAAAQRDAFKIGLDALDVRTQTAREALKQARADDDRGAEVEIEAHIRQLEKLRGDIESNMGKVPSDEQIQQAFAQHRERMRPQRQARATQGSDDGRPLNDLAHRWAGQNAWMDDPNKADEKKTLVSVSQQIAREGLDPNSQEHFTELTKRMAKSFPNLGVRDLAGRQLGASRGQPQNQRRASNPPPVGGSRGTAGPMTNSNKVPRNVDLDQSDRRMMRNLGLDPTDKKQVSYFAKERLTRMQKEARNAGGR